VEKFAIGQAVPRTEDPRLLRGRGRYVDDIVLPRMVRAYVLRSPHAHAEIRSIDTAAAKDVPGVLGIYTGADYAASGNGSHVSDVSSRVPGKVDAYNTTQLALAIERVRFVGEGVVLIVAETLEAAKDASELIAVDYDPLPANVNTARAVEPGAIQVWGDCPGNVSYVYESGDKARVDAAFAAAHHVTRRRFVINRITANAMEPRGCIAEYDEGSGRYTIHVGVQSPHGMRQMLNGLLIGPNPFSLTTKPATISATPSWPSMRRANFWLCGSIPSPISAPTWATMARRRRSPIWAASPGSIQRRRSSCR
jgi:carbon-monoxide dehydrogenase large subunit